MTSIFFRLIYVCFNIPLLGIALILSMCLFIPAVALEYVIFGTADKKTSTTFYKIFCFVDDMFIEKRKFNNVKKDIWNNIRLI